MKEKGGPAMDMQELMLRLLDLQKASFANGFAALDTIQDETERVANDFMDQAGWVPAVSKGALKDWFSLVRKSRNDLKKAIDDGYAHMGGHISSALHKGQ